MIIDIVLAYLVGHGGLEKVVNKVCTGLINKGHKVRIFLSFPSDFKEWLNGINEVYYYSDVNIYQDKKYIENAESYRKITDKIGKPDIILCTHLPGISYMCYLSLNEEERKRIPLVSWIHGRMIAYSDVDLLKYSDYHLSISNRVGEDIYKVTQCSKIYYIGSPIENKGINVINRPEDEYVFLFLARFDRDKKVDMLLEAFSGVKGNWRVEMFGGGVNEQIYKILAKTYRISDKIKWNGWVENPWNQIKKASATIITSIAEGFSVTTGESLVRGVPVISTICGGPEDMIKDGVNGWLYEVNDMKKLRYILNKIVSNEWKLPTEEKCVDSIKNLYEDNVINNIEKILIQIKGEKINDY